LISERWYVGKLQRFGIFKLALNGGEDRSFCNRYGRIVASRADRMLTALTFATHHGNKSLKTVSKSPLQFCSHRLHCA
jgi:hypothetical protein